MDAPARVRQHIKRLLEHGGITQRRLASAVGHGDQWLSNLLASRSLLSLRDLDAVAKALGVPPGELVREAGDAWELSPTEIRVVRALRMLPPVVRDHLVLFTDYLVGATPPEVELLKRVRQLTADQLRRIEHYMDVELLARGTEPSQASPADLRVTDLTPAARVRRTRKNATDQR